MSSAVREAAGCVMTHKYAEGYPGKRYYGGCEFVDEVEVLARERAAKLFTAGYVNVQPHSGSQANMAVYSAFLEPGDAILGMNLAHGGHLTHGSPVNFSGKLYRTAFYGVEKDTGLIDYDQVARIAKELRPKMIVTGASAYPRFWDWPKFREIASSVGAFLMADIAHPAGLIASAIHPTPIPYCDVVTTTTHKTLRGPRGGMILVGNDTPNSLGITAPKSGRTKMVSEIIDSAVMPGIQGGPFMNVIAAKAVCFGEALAADFKTYSTQIVSNARSLGERLMQLGYCLVSGGTDNHLLLVDLSELDITGKSAEKALEAAGITANKNLIPFDSKGAMTTSGIRLGTPALTTRGMKEDEMKLTADLIDRVLRNIDDDGVKSQVRGQVKEIGSHFPLYAQGSRREETVRADGV